MQPMTTTLTLDEFQQTPELQLLSAKQATFVLRLVESYRASGDFDPAAACVAAYNCKTPEIAKRFSYELLGHPRIVAALDRALGQEITLPRHFVKAIERATIKGRLNAQQLRDLRSLARNGSDAVTKALLIRETHKQLRAAPEGSVAAKDLLYLLKNLLYGETAAATSENPTPEPTQIGKRELNRRAKEQREAEQREKQDQREMARINEEFGF